MLVSILPRWTATTTKTNLNTYTANITALVLHTAAGIIKNPTLAEDAVHETFQQLLRGIDTLRIDNERAL